MRELDASLESLRGAAGEYAARYRQDLSRRTRSAGPSEGAADANGIRTSMARAEAAPRNLRNRIATLLRAFAGKLFGGRRD